MEIKYKDIILRDYKEADIDDDIRWYNEETAWVEADTPWEPMEPVDPEEYRKRRMEELKHIPNDASWRWRLEIEAEGRHIGFVTCIPKDENYKPLAPELRVEGMKITFELGIEICEPDFWGRGYGTKAMAAFIGYQLENGRRALCMETRSGNERMLKSAAKLGFFEFRREKEAFEANGVKFDLILLCIDEEKFNEIY